MENPSPVHSRQTLPQEWTDFPPTSPLTYGLAAPNSSALDEESQGLPPGTLLGEFEVVRVIGAGGFGIVYEAWDHSLERTIALKEFMPAALVFRDSTTVRLRSERHHDAFSAGLSSFVNEARSLARLEHSALVRVYRYWEANATAYMAMPLYEGPTLKQYLRDYRYTVDDDCVLSVLDPLTEALELVHVSDLVHRDVSPDNIILIRSVRKPVLLDFGAARKVIGEMSKAVTVILKPTYAPVEQYGNMPGLSLGPWTDVYALAATMHYAIAGQPPPLAVGRIHEDTYTPLAQTFKGLFSERILKAIDQGLAVLPKDRLDSMAAFRDALGLQPPRLACFQRAVPRAASPSALAGSEASPGAPRLASRTPPGAADRARGPSSDSPSALAAGADQRLGSAAQVSWFEPSGFVFPRAGDRLLERFRIREMVVYDGAQQCFRALDEQRNVEVLVQALSPRLFLGAEAEAAQWRFAKRCAACTHLDHSVWSPEFSWFVWQEARLVVSPFLGGRSLRAVIQECKRERRPLALAAVHRMLTSLAEGLDRLHSKAVHGGLCPDLIVVGPDGHCRVLGLGLGGVFSHEALQVAGGFSGSQAYQAPEALGGEAGSPMEGDRLELDGRADQYALAAMAFELLAGCRRNQTADALHVRNAEVPLGISQVLRRAMSLSREGRFESLSAFLQAWDLAMEAAFPHRQGQLSDLEEATLSRLPEDGNDWPPLPFPHEERAPGAAAGWMPRRFGRLWLLGLLPLSLLCVGFLWA